MNDDELRRLLQGALSSRRVPAETRERLLLTLHRRRRSAWLAFAAAAILVGLVSAALLRPGAPPPPPVVLRDAVRHHVEARMFGHAASDRSEIAEMVGEACGREIEIPALRDGGFVQMQAHGCERMGGVHVIYANSWLKASCFVMSMCTAGFDTGRLVTESGIQARIWEIDGHSVVAVPEGDVVKVWVADLRPSQLSAIAVDTELKRFQVKTAVFTVNDAAISGPLRATLRATPGVEEVRLEDSRKEAVIRYDRRRISPDELAAMMVLNGFPAGPREWGGR